MTVYSTQFFFVTYEGPDPNFVYTVPAGFVDVFRTIAAHDPHGGCICSVGNTESPYLIGCTFLPGSEEFHGLTNCYAVFNAGEDIYVSANNNDTQIAAFGYRLNLL